MTRKTITTDEAPHEAFKAHKREGETWDALLLRAAEALESTDDGVNEIECTPDAVAAAVAERLDIPDTEDIATETSTRTVTELRTELR